MANNGTKVTLAVIKSQLDTMHEGQKRMDSKLDVVCGMASINSAWIQDHKDQHRGYIGMIVAAAGMVSTAFFFVLNVVFNR